MEDTTIRRYSSGLVLVGFLILVPATLWLVVMGMFVLTTVFATAPRSQADLMKQARRDTVRELQGIRGLPAVVVTEFEREGQPREATLKALRPQQRQQVQEALAQYHGAVAGASLWPVIGALAGGWL